MDEAKRNRLFKFACIPMRILIIVLLVLFAKYERTRIAASALCFLVASTFTVKYIWKHMVGGFGGYAFWHPNRPKHALLYLTTGILLLLGFEWAGYVLIADVLLGIYSYSFKETAKDIEQFKDSIPAF